MISKRPGSGRLLLLGWLSLPICLAMLLFSFPVARGSGSATRWDGVIFSTIVLILALREVRQWFELERNGWWETVDVNMPSVPCQFHSGRKFLGSPSRTALEFYEDYVLIKRIRVKSTKIFYGEIKVVAVSPDGAILELRRSLRASYPIGLTPESFDDFESLKKPERVAVLNLLRQLVPEATFDAMAEHMRKGNVPRVK